MAMAKKNKKTGLSMLLEGAHVAYGVKGSENPQKGRHQGEHKTHGIDTQLDPGTGQHLGKGTGENLAAKNGRNLGRHRDKHQNRHPNDEFAAQGRLVAGQHDWENPRHGHKNYY